MVLRRSALGFFCHQNARDRHYFPYMSNYSNLPLGLCEGALALLETVLLMLLRCCSMLGRGGIGRLTSALDVNLQFEVEAHS